MSIEFDILLDSIKDNDFSQFRKMIELLRPSEKIFSDETDDTGKNLIFHSIMNGCTDISKSLLHGYWEFDNKELIDTIKKSNNKNDNKLLQYIQLIFRRTSFPLKTIMKF